MNRLTLVAAVVWSLAVAPAVSQAATWPVSTFSGLTSAISSASNDDTILLAPGTYNVTSNLYITKRLTFQGASGNRDDVVLCGRGMNVESGPLEGIWTANDGIQIRNLTVTGFYDHGIHVCDNPSGNLADNVVISNVKIQNCGERYIKGSGNGTSNNVLIENVLFQQNETWLPHTGHDNNYVGGIDAQHTDNWIIRDCRFEGIMGADGGARGAIFLWVGTTNPTIERNVIVNCAEGIDLGNGYNPTGTWHVVGGIVRNNFIGWGGGDNRAVQLGFTKDVRFYNNTIYTDANYNRAVHIYDGSGIPTTNVVLENNLIRGAIVDTSTGSATLINNITGATPQANWFVNALASDLHLTALATGAIDQGLALADVPEDFDRQARPIGSAPDIGGDEFIPEPATMTLICGAAFGLLLKRRRHA